MKEKITLVNIETAIDPTIKFVEFTSKEPHQIEHVPNQNKFKLVSSRNIESSHFIKSSPLKRQESSVTINGKTYYNSQTLGKGTYCLARKFTTRDQNNLAIAVLSPLNKAGSFTIDFKEVRDKINFFMTIYPDKPVAYFKSEKEINKQSTNYRVVIPFISGKPYQEIRVTSELLPKLMLSAVIALKDCHNKGYIVLDLKADNILFQEETKISYLIDGGISVKTEKVPKKLEVVDEAKKAEYLIKYPHMAPESLYVLPNTVTAKPNMDVYSLGIMFAKIMLLNKLNDPAIARLVEACVRKNPEERITLNVLETRLNSIINQIPIKIFFNDEKEIIASSKSYLTQLVSSNLKSKIPMISTLESIEQENQHDNLMHKSPLPHTPKASLALNPITFLGKRKRTNSLTTHCENDEKINVNNGMS